MFNGKALVKSQVAEKEAYILHGSYIFSGLSLEENISLATNLDSVRMNRVIEETNLVHLKEQVLRASNLSGGEKQRIEIARSLYHQKAFILADEVKSNLDCKNAQLIEDILFSVPQTVIEVIHHYSDENLSRYDHVINLSKENTT